MIFLFGCCSSCRDEWILIMGCFVISFNSFDRIWCLWWMLYETDEYYWSLKLMFLLNYRLLLWIGPRVIFDGDVVENQLKLLCKTNFFLDMCLICMNFSLKFLKNCMLKYFSLCGTLFMIWLIYFSCGLEEQFFSNEPNLCKKLANYRATKQNHPNKTTQKEKEQHHGPRPIQPSTPSA